MYKRLSISFLLLASSCSVLKASPAADSGFLPHGDRLAPQNKRSPFNAVWYADQKKLDKMKEEYRGFYIMPVNTAFLESQIRAQNISEHLKKERIEDLHEIAKYMEQRLKIALAEYPKHPVKVLDQIEPETLVLETTITELIPTNTAVTTFGTAAGVFVPPAALLSLAGAGSIAMEAILRDSDTGDSLVEIRDRESDKTAPISVKDYQRYAHIREAIDDWSRTLAELAATPYTHKVKGPLPFTLNPF
jgi:hypothetical protein